MKIINNTYYGIGDIVPNDLINALTTIIDKVGIDSFQEMIHNGDFRDYTYAYVHPCDEMCSTPMFSEIQKCYIAKIVNMEIDLADEYT
jgi:hypothetical protein